MTYHALVVDDSPDVLDDVNNSDTIERVKQQVLDICKRLPVYG